MRKIFVIIIVVLIVLSGLYFIRLPEAKHIVWGVNFSQTQAENLQLNWKETYLALLEDIGVKHIKILTQWNLVNPKENSFSFDGIDWQLAEAKAHGADVIYVLGMKTGRWPECHIPDWASNLSREEQQKNILNYIQAVVMRYKDDPVVSAWQVENEPLFNFGECPWYDREFLKKEVALIKSLNASRQIIISDTGENSLWLIAASIGDKVSATMYRKVWMSLPYGLGMYFTWPLPAWTYSAKSALVQAFFHKKVFVGELQAEPWNSQLFYDNVPLQEQEKSMNITQLKDTIAYARGTGFDEFYLWGAEWWYWLKVKQQKPEIFEYVKTLF